MGKGLTQSEQLTATRLMIRGLSNNAEKLARRGITPEFISRMEEVQSQVITYDGEQEELKAKLKEKTSQSDSARSELGQMLSEAKKVVKMEVCQERWREYGIEDVR
jgi:hypothetical protein